MSEMDPFLMNEPYYPGGRPGNWDPNADPTAGLPQGYHYIGWEGQIADANNVVVYDPRQGWVGPGPAPAWVASLAQVGGPAQTNALASLTPTPAASNALQAPQTPRQPARRPLGALPTEGDPGDDQGVSYGATNPAQGYVGDPAELGAQYGADKGLGGVQDFDWGRFWGFLADAATTVAPGGFGLQAANKGYNIATGEKGSLGDKVENYIGPPGNDRAPGMDASWNLAPYGAPPNALQAAALRANQPEVDSGTGTGGTGVQAGLTADYGGVGYDYAGDESDYGGGDQSATAGLTADYGGASYDFAGDDQDYGGGDQSATAGLSADYGGAGYDYAGDDQDYGGEW